MTGYKMNFATKTVTITKAFAEKASKPNTAEANLLCHLNTIVPSLKISYKTRCSSGSHPNKGLTYRRMKEYINFHENADELMQAYTTIKDIAKLQKNPHNYVCRWFKKQFPDYEEIPMIKDGKIMAVPIVTLPAEEKNLKQLGTSINTISITEREAA